VNVRLTLGLAKRDGAGGEILPQAAEFLDHLGFDRRRAARSGDKAVERSRRIRRSSTDLKPFPAPRRPSRRRQSLRSDQARRCQIRERDVRCRRRRRITMPARRRMSPKVRARFAMCSGGA
jgi:hypothetical protein